MNRIKIPLADKYDKWYQNPFIRLMILAAVLVVMIIICANVFNGGSGTASAAADTALTKDINAEDGTVPENASGDMSALQASVDTAADAAVSSADAAAPAAEAQTVEGAYAPGAPDGTGNAGVMPLTEEMAAASPETGWHFTYKGMWYSPAPGFCYYNGWQTVDGNEYHFGENGLKDIGWKRIGDQACCFGSDGIYQPDASTEKMVAFTFDDGPSQGMDQILDLCSETGARVTFFMIGAQVENGGAVIPFILEQHCQLGNHSYSHSLMLDKTPEECAADFAKGDDFIRSFSGGIGADVVRFPYGDVTEEHMNAVGKPAILWDIDSLDWESQDAEQIKERVYSQLGDGNIILMHDRYDATVEACRELFPNLIANGYQLVTVSELAAAKGVEMQPGVEYTNF